MGQDATTRLGEFFVNSDEMVDSRMHHGYGGCRWCVELPSNPSLPEWGIPLGLMVDLAEAHLAECREQAPAETVRVTYTRLSGMPIPEKGTRLTFGDAGLGGAHFLVTSEPTVGEDGTFTFDLERVAS